MKGQYLAVETVFVFGLGLLVAIGVITLFNQFKLGALDDARPEQAEIINSEIENAFLTAKNVDDLPKNSTVSYQVDLPSSLAGSDYSIDTEDQSIVITSDSESFENSLTGFRNYDISGSSRGGDITVFKQQNQLEIRSR